MYFEEFALVYDCFDYFQHIVRQIGIIRNQAVQFVFQTIDRVVAYHHRRFFEVVGRQIRKQITDQRNTFFFVFYHKMRNARFGRVNFCTSQVFCTDIFAGNGFYHLRSGNEHVRTLIGHQDEIGQGRRVYGSTGTGAENSGYLWNNPGSQDVTLENFSISCQ